jgi:RNA polymerase sigma-70 factor (ECF subfamily)
MTTNGSTSSHLPSASVEPTDADLLALLRAGDASALDRLYRRHGATLRRLASRVLACDAEAEDVVQDAFLTLPVRAARYEAERGSVSVWLASVVRNLSRDRYRERARRARAHMSPRSRPTEGAPTPERELESAMLAAAVRGVVRTLPDHYRVGLEAVMYDGASYPELAARGAIPLGTVKSRGARAIAHLRSTIGRDAELCGAWFPDRAVA